jgi:hypothetical protein
VTAKTSALGCLYIVECFVTLDKIEHGALLVGISLLIGLTAYAFLARRKRIGRVPPISNHPYRK